MENSHAWPRVVLTLVLIVLFNGCLCSSALAQPIVIKFSHVVAENTPKGKAAIFFAARAAELTSGRVKVEVYGNSSLYDDTEGLKALREGKIQMLAPSLAKFGGLGVTVFEAFDLPYLFSDYASLHKITRGRVGEEILRQLEPYGIHGLAFWDNGFKSFSANFPIRTPDDMQGKIFRIQPSDVLAEQMRTLGAIPKPMAFSQVYDALATGVAQGTENPPSNMYTKLFNNVQSNMILTEHGYLGYAVIVNKKFWDGLPREIRSQLTVAIQQATDMANRTAKSENDRALQMIEQSHTTEIYRPTIAERLAFKKQLLPVHEKMANHIDKKILKEIYEETGFDPDSFSSRPPRSTGWIFSRWLSD